MFERISFRAERQPEIEGGADGGLDFIGVEDSACVRDGGLARQKGERLGNRVSRTVRAVREPGVLAGEAEDFGFEFRQGIHGTDTDISGPRANG